MINQNLLLASDDAYLIQRSLRFRRSASAYLSRTFGTPTNGAKWTVSYWAKLGLIGRANHFAPNLSTNEGSISIESDYKLYVNARVGTPGGAGTNYYVATNQLFRDSSAWYHIVVALDTTQSTASNRTRVYINGTEVTSFSSASYPPQNSTPIMGSAVVHAIGRVGESGYEYYYDGYMTEFNFVDGQQLTPSSFGETDAQTGVWKPKKYAGTYGTNGFYLPFTDNSVTTSGSNVGLGKDFSGNGNYWNTNNISLAGASYTSYTSGSGNYTVPAGVTSINYLVVAGGGGAGGNAFNGGGGGGGVLAGSMSVTPGQTIAYSVGAGGAGGSGGTNGSNGSNSTLGSLTAIGGGAGGSTANGAGSSGGSGGGGAGGSSGTGAAGAGTTGQGFAGGTGYGAGSGLWGAGGGGGAGGVGESGSSGKGGNGGSGYTWINGSTYGGGGGGATGVGNTAGTGGTGGGGAGSNSSSGTSGTANTGGGGGGASGTNTGGSGGSGIVIIAVGGSTTYDSMTDVPTLTSESAANYCVLNPIIPTNFTLSNGNLNAAGSNEVGAAIATFGMSSGKWYWESTGLTGSNGNHAFGVCNSTALGKSEPNGTAGFWVTNGINGNKYANGGAGSAFMSSYTNNDVIGLAFDADAGTLAYYKNGVSQGTAFTGLTSGPYYAINGYESSVAWANCINFGQRPFVYTPPSGFKALNTYNLPTPTIGATSSTLANKNMDATLYTGNGTSLTITNAGSFQPDFVWLKSRSNATNNTQWDSLRGATNYLVSNTTAAQATYAGGLTAFNSNGFSIGDGSDINVNAATYVGWQWKAGQGTTSSNTSGSITSTTSVNASAGFSIVTFTAGSGNQTVGHGLGVAPNMVILKRRNSISAWLVYHSSLSNPATSFLELNTTSAVQSASPIWGASGMTSTTIGTSDNITINGGTYVAYCFAAIAGYSAFGSYTGNGSSDGPFVYCGFRPKFIITKLSSAVGNWRMRDTSRDPYNVSQNIFYANTNGAEIVDNQVDILSNGFKLRNGLAQENPSGGTIIYMAFAENPFKYSLAR